MSNLNDSLGRLARFRASWTDGDVIDAGSGLTTNDLDVIITMAPALALDVQGKPIPGDHDRLG